MVRVAIDGMGGDSAPEMIIEGIRRFRKEDTETEVLVTGPPEVLESKLADLGCILVPASQVVAMDESPSTVIKTRRDSSIAKAIALVKEDRADSIVTMGNSGAAMALALFQLGRVPGVSRPSIMTPMPNSNGRTLVADVGAVVDCKPEHLLHFAVLASVYASEVYEVESPRVGILSIGEEKCKGNELSCAAHALLEKSGLNFIGNVEGNHVFDGTVDVVVCDGFVGNVILKFGEGLAEFIMNSMRSSLRHVIEQSHDDVEASKKKQEFFRSVVSGADYTEIGCAPLLGVSGVCLIGHGRSAPRAVASAIGTARTAAAHREVIQRQEIVLREVLDRLAVEQPVLT